MTSRQRLLAAFKGEAVDRAPIWPREGFPILSGPAPPDDFMNGWQSQPLYRELFDYVKPYADVFAQFGMPCQNRHLMVPPRYMRRETILDTPELKQVELTIATPRGELTHITEQRHWQATTWHTKEAVRSIEELEMLASVPFELDVGTIDEARNDFLRVREQHGMTHVLKSWVSSPIVCISGCMPLALFLELSYTHREWFLELCDEITKRILSVCDRFFTDDIDWTDVVVAMGGSEQCTPPLMHPGSFDELVVPFDSRIIDFLRSKGMLIQNHCHGKVRHALECMVAMGVDATDPVEPPPAGDVTFGEAQQVTQGKLTLMGNLELDMLEYGTPGMIRAHVKDVFKNGNRRVVVGTSAGPMMPVSRRLVDNYKALFDAALEYGA